MSGQVKMKYGGEKVMKTNSSKMEIHVGIDLDIDVFEFLQAEMHNISSSFSFIIPNLVQSSFGCFLSAYHIFFFFFLDVPFRLCQANILTKSSLACV